MAESYAGPLWKNLRTRHESEVADEFDAEPNFMMHMYKLDLGDLGGISGVTDYIFDTWSYGCMHAAARPPENESCMYAVSLGGKSASSTARK